MNYLQSNSLGEKSKEMLSLLSSGNNMEDRAEALKSIISDDYFSFQKKEILDYILYLPQDESDEKKLLLKTLNIILLTSKKDVKNHKNTLLQIMAEDEDFAESIAFYFKRENPNCLNESDAGFIKQAEKNGKISEEESEKLINIALKKEAYDSEKMEKLFFLEKNLSTKNTADAIRKATIEDQSVSILGSYIYNEILEKIKDSTTFDYDTQYLTSTMLNDSNISKNGAEYFLNAFDNDLGRRFIKDEIDEKNTMNMLHIMNDSEIFLSDKKLYSKLIGSAIAINARYDSDDIPLIDYDMSEIINSNLDEIDLPTLFEQSISFAKDYQNHYPKIKKMHNEKIKNMPEEEYFPECKLPRFVLQDTARLLEYVVETMVKTNVEIKNSPKVIELLENLPLEKDEETIKSFRGLQSKLIKINQTDVFNMKKDSGNFR